ncbi:MAG: D-alanyl-D-alanine carboxypeptidase family protein [Clostridia bacterium]|nr:D-alanyl-D-alanine carboxypeptidase [Clostridia bacterium]MDH7573968.1 D-alanyl-D-alanine carboxypeptidase family protein [Clostridia bacterium]
MVLLGILVWLWSVPAHAQNEPEIGAAGGVLMDASSGRVLYAKNPHLSLPPASTTKITTAILALERGRLDQVVKVSKEAAETPEAAIWLEEGEELTLEELLYALMLRSANDAAAAIAEAVGGTQEDFVELMNERARELGARDTHYVNPHGLDDPDHYTSAYDLAVLTRHALTLPDFRRIVSTKQRTIPWAGHPWERVLHNRNRLLVGPDPYPGAIGVKTGYTRRAGSCLVGAARHGDLELIAVVLNSPDMYGEVKGLLDYGFEHFRSQAAVRRNQQVAWLPVSRGQADRVKIVAGSDVRVAVRPEEAARIETRFTLPPQLTAPVAQGEIVGRIEVLLDGQEMGTANLVAAEAVSRRGFWSYFLQALLSVFSFG